MSPVCNPQYQWAMLGRVTTPTTYLPVLHLLIHGCLSVVVGTGDNQVNRFYRATCTGGCLVVCSWSVRRREVSGDFWSMAFRGLAIKSSSFP